MTAGKSVVPEFGPNGAVMNGPNMTAEMRDKIEKSYPRSHLPKLMQRLFVGMSAIGFCLLAASIAVRLEHPGIAMGLAFAGLLLAVVSLTWRTLLLRKLKRQSR